MPSPPSPASPQQLLTCKLVLLFGCTCITWLGGCLTTLDLSDDFPDATDMAPDATITPDLSPQDMTRPDDMPDMPAEMGVLDMPDMPSPPEDMPMDMPGEDMPDLPASLPGEGLIISEVIEGSSGFNKAVELYNTRRAPLELTNLFLILLSQNGTELSDAKILALDKGDIKTLPANGILRLCHSSVSEITLAECDLDDQFSINFNGDDRIALFYDGDQNNAITSSPADRLIDSFGQLSNDPPPEDTWANKAFRRCNPMPYLDDRIFNVETYYEVIDPENFSDFGTAPTLTSCP